MLQDVAMINNCDGRQGGYATFHCQNAHLTKGTIKFNAEPFLGAFSIQIFKAAPLEYPFNAK